MANWSNATQRTCCYGIAYGSNSFWLFGLNFGPLLLGSFLVAIGLFGFSIFTNPIFGCNTIFDHLDFMQILITKYATRFLKAMRNILFNFSFVFVICSWLIAYVVLRYLALFIGNKFYTFSKLENLFKLKCAWLENFILRKNKLEKDWRAFFSF